MIGLKLGLRRQALLHPGPDCRKVVGRRAPPGTLGFLYLKNKYKKLGIRWEEAVSAAVKRGGLGSRAIGVGCSSRKCRLQKSVRGIFSRGRRSRREACSKKARIA